MNIPIISLQGKNILCQPNTHYPLLLEMDIPFKNALKVILKQMPIFAGKNVLKLPFDSDFLI